MHLFLRTYGEGEPLVILHGFIGSSDNWHTLAQKFGDRFRVRVPDLRNHGRSPHAADVSIPAMAEDIRELLDEQGLASTHLIGHSLGGKVAMQLALTRPERVRRLVVADVAMHAYPPSQLGTVLSAMQGLDLSAMATRNAADAALAVTIHNPAVRQLLLKNLGRGDDGRLCWRCNLAGFANDLPRILAAVELPGRQFPGPALFLRGGRSDYVTDASLHEIRRHFPQAQATTIPAAGHWLHADAPDAFFAQVTAFFPAAVA